MSCIVQLWLEAEVIFPDKPRPYRFFETDAKDYDDFLEWVEADELIRGRIVHHVSHAPGVRRITELTPVAIRGCTVIRCQPPKWTFVHATETAP